MEEEELKAKGVPFNLIQPVLFDGCLVVSRVQVSTRFLTTLKGPHSPCECLTHYAQSPAFKHDSTILVLKSMILRYPMVPPI